MCDESREQIKHAIRHFRLPAYEEITDVGLYLDQTTRYINEYMFPLSEDMTITSSMISNYVKRQLVPNPVHKQYSRDQIATLIGITMTKNLLSLDNIYILTHNYKDYSARELYNCFRDELNKALSSTFGIEDQSTDTADTDDDILLIRTLTKAVANKIYLDVCFKAIASNGEVSLPPKKHRDSKKNKNGIDYSSVPVSDLDGPC